MHVLTAATLLDFAVALALAAALFLPQQRYPGERWQPLLAMNPETSAWHHAAHIQQQQADVDVVVISDDPS